MDLGFRMDKNSLAEYIFQDMLTGKRPIGAHELNEERAEKGMRDVAIGQLGSKPFEEQY